MLADPRTGNRPYYSRAQMPLGVLVDAAVRPAIHDPLEVKIQKADDLKLSQTNQQRQSIRNGSSVYVLRLRATVRGPYPLM